MPCPLCDDTGWKPVDADGVRRVVRCDCWRESVGQQRLADANMPKRYQHCTIANFTVYNESLERAADRARQLAERFPVVDKGLFFEGQPGVGKTHLAVAVLKQVDPDDRRARPVLRHARSAAASSAAPTTRRSARPSSRFCGR